ncbi:MAG: SIS domain-containing protein [Bacillota bacterium]
MYNDYESLVKLYHQKEHFLFLGRGLNYPVALIDRDMPVICLVPQDNVYEKMISQVEQVHNRNGIVISLINEGDEAVANKSNHVLRIPRAHPLLTPIIAVMPLQFLAYHTAVRRGADVDQPRNLAKSVTVEQKRLVLSSKD